MIPDLPGEAREVRGAQAESRGGDRLTWKIPGRLKEDVGKVHRASREGDGSRWMFSTGRMFGDRL